MSTAAPRHGPTPDQARRPLAGAPTLHRWRLSHLDSAGVLRRMELDAPSNAQACDWAEQRYGCARMVACVRLGPAFAH